MLVDFENAIAKFRRFSGIVFVVCRVVRRPQAVRDRIRFGEDEHEEIPRIFLQQVLRRARALFRRVFQRVQKNLAASLRVHFIRINDIISNL